MPYDFSINRGRQVEETEAQSPQTQSSISDSESTNMASTSNSTGKTKPKKKKYKSKHPLTTPPTIPSIQAPSSLRLNIEQVAYSTRAAYTFLSKNDLRLHPSQTLSLESKISNPIIDNLAHLFELKSDVNRIVVGFGWISLPNCCGVLGFDRFKVEGDLFGEDGFLMVQALGGQFGEGGNYFANGGKQIYFAK